eukprot:s433_g1.t1
MFRGRSAEKMPQQNSLHAPCKLMCTSSSPRKQILQGAGSITRQEEPISTRKMVKEADDNILQQTATSQQRLRARMWAAFPNRQGPRLSHFHNSPDSPGWNNFALRSLAQGRYASILFARSMKEATFMSFPMQKFRESKADLDQFAQVYCDQQGLTVDSSLSESAQKSAKMKHFCESIYNRCKQYQQQELCDAQERIKELEQQLVQAQKSAPTSTFVKTPQ